MRIPLQMLFVESNSLALYVLASFQIKLLPCAINNVDLYLVIVEKS